MHISNQKGDLQKSIFATNQQFFGKVPQPGWEIIFLTRMQV